MIDNNKTISFSIKVILSEEEFQKLQTLIRIPIEEGMIAKKEKELLSFKEVCELLSISASCLNTWKSQGKIPHKKIGKRIFFLRSEVTAALEEGGNYRKLRDLR